MHGPVRRFRRLSVVVLLAGTFATTVAATSYAAPVAPTGLSPSNTVIRTNPVLTWSPVAGAAKYDVQLSTDPSFSSLGYTVTTAQTAATPTGTIGGPAGGSIYWRVRAVDGSGVAGAFADAQFTRNPFPGPVLTAPTANAVLPFPGSPPQFSWTPLPGMASYVLQIDDAADFVSASSYTTANPSYVLTTPQAANQLYYWRVQGVTKDGVVSAFSDVRTYTVGAIAAPVPTSPLNTTDTPIDDVVLSWTPVAGASTYDLQVSPNIDFTNNSVDIQGIRSTRWSPVTTLLNGSYYWRVRARDAQVPPAFGAWSDVWSFRRGWPAQPTLLMPSNGAQATDYGPSFRWTSVPFADRYELDLGIDHNFSPGTYLKCFTNHVAFTPQVTVAQAQQAVTNGSDPDCLATAPSQAVTTSEPTPGVPYYWRVRGIDEPAGALGVFSEVWSFTYAPNAATTGGLTILGPPSNDSVSVPTLSWTEVPNASHYQVQVLDSRGNTVANVTTAATSWTSANQLFAANGPYTWQVEAKTEGGDLYAGRQGAFDVVAPPSTYSSPDPLVAQPDNGIRMPALSWQPVTDATSYQVWVATPGSTTFFQLGGNDFYPATTFTGGVSNGFNVLAPGSYQWFVVANTPSGPVASAPSTYTVDPVDAATGEAVDSGWDSASGGPRVHCTTGTNAQSPCPESDTPTLRWNTVPHAGFYYVYISTDAAHTNVVHTYATSATQLTPRESLKDSQAGQTYFWFVRPCTIDGACGPLGDGGSLDFSETFRKQSTAETGVSATVGTPPSSWPSAPCVTPVQKASVDQGLAAAPVISDQVTFCWDDFLAINKRADPVVSDQDAKTYRLQVSPTSDFPLPLLDAPEVDQTTFTATTKTYPEGPLFWRVQAVDGSGNALTYSPTYQLLKLSAAPTITAPASDASVDQAPILSWAAQPFASSYEVEVYKNASASLTPDTNYSAVNRVLDGTTKEAAYSDTASLPSGTYAWRVRRLDADNRPGSWQQLIDGKPLLFSVSPAPPTPLSPTSGSTPRPGSLVFSWTAAPGASAYRLESATNASFSLLRERQDTVSLAWAPTSQYPTGTYYWRVSALDGSGHVLATSGVWTFTVDSTPPTVLSKSPTTAAALSTSFAVTFSERVEGVSAGTFQLWVGNRQVAAAVAPSSDGLSARLQPAQPLEPGATYTAKLTSGVSDLAGNALVPKSWSVRATTIVDSTSVAVHEAWARQALRGTVGGHYVQTATAGAAATVSFVGTSVALVARTLPAGGYASVRLDGAPATRVSFYSSVSRLQRVVFKRTGLRAGAHRLVVVASGSRPLRSKGTIVALDAVRVGSSVLDESGQAWNLALRRAHTRLAFGGSYDVERAARARGEVMPSYTVAFTGSGLTLYAIKGPTGGKAVVSIDGRALATVDLFAARVARAAVFTRSTSAGHHVLRLTVAGLRATASKGTDVALDYLVVR